MYIFLSSLLALGILFLFLHYLSFGRKKSSGSPKLPPGNFGWPIIRESLHFKSALVEGCPEKFFKDRMDKFSPTLIVKTSILGEKMVFLDGPLGNNFMYANENKLVVTWWPNSVKQIFFPGASPEQMMDRARASIQEALKPEAYSRYITIIQEVVEDHLVKDWIPKNELIAHPLSKKLVFAIVSRIIIGLADEPQMDVLHDLLKEVLAGVISLPINFPGTPYYRAIKASIQFREELISIIKKKRSQLLSTETNLDTPKDVFSSWVLQKEKDGNFISDVEIAKRIFAFIAASYGTTSILLTSLIYYLAGHPRVYAQVLEEHMNISNSKSPLMGLTLEDFHQHMKYSGNVITETLRFATLLGQFRVATTDITFGGCMIPKGWKIFLSGHAVHMDEKYFPNPKTFDPSRFEGSMPTPFTYIPFGGGPRKCPGGSLALIVASVFMHCLVTKFRWEKIIPEEKMTFYPEPKPEKGLPIRLFPHGN